MKKLLLVITLIASPYSLFGMDLGKLGLDAHRAVIENDKENLSWLIENRHRSVFERDHWGNTILHIAVLQGNVEMTYDLMQAGFNPNEGNCLGKTALMIAAENEDSKMVKFLTGRGVEMGAGAMDSVGSNPLVVALRSKMKGSGLTVKAIQRGIGERVTASLIARLGSAAYPIEQ